MLEPDQNGETHALASTGRSSSQSELVRRYHRSAGGGRWYFYRPSGRRLERLQIVMDASDVLYRRGHSDSLTEEECIALSSSNFFNINAPGLPSLDELIATGRLEIIRDTELRRALIGLQQTRATLSAMIAIQSGASTFTHLPSIYPDLTVRQGS